MAARRLLALRLAPVDGDPFDFEHRKPPNGTREATFAFQIEYEGCRRRDLRRQLARIDARYGRCGASDLDAAAETGQELARPLVVGNEEHRFLVIEQLGR